MSSDPLSFFAAGDSSSSESDSGDEENTAAQDKEVGEEPLNAPGSPKGVDKLPSPDTLFATVGRPAFLDNPLEGHINWDRFVKTPDPLPEPNVHSSGNYAAIPPPKEEDLGGSAKMSAGVDTISAPPIRYSAPSELDPKQLTVSNKLPSEEGTGVKRPHKGDETGESMSNKKLKSETFRQKEKRKRDLGQSSRGKSYVEEEKRILRQQYKLDEVPT